jgi:hypothetical protein
LAFRDFQADIFQIMFSCADDFNFLHSVPMIP